MKRLHIAFVALACVGALLPWTDALQTAEDRSVDTRFKVRGPLPERSRVIIVAIDDATETAWRDLPKAMWSGQLAKIVTALKDAGVARIGLDFVVAADPDNYLSSKGIDETPNADLDRAIVESGERVLLGTASAGDVVPPLDVTERLVSVNRTQEMSGVVRQVPRWDRTFVPPLRGLAAAFAGEPPQRQDPVNVNYSGRKPYVISALDVVQGRTPKGFLRGSFVIVGETYQATADMHSTPFGGRVPGVEIQAEAARTLLDRDELVIGSRLSASAATMISALLGGLLAARVMLGRFVLVSAGAALLWSGVCLAAFSQMHTVLPWIGPIFGLTILAPAVVYAVRTLDEHLERMYVRARWGQLVGDSTLRRLEANRQSGRGAWDRFQCGLMFLDIADFSSFTRSSEGERTIAILNSLFSVVIHRVEQSGGEVLNFMGDGLAAKWELSEFEDRDAHALIFQTALEILSELDAIQSQSDHGQPKLGARIGLSSGEATLALIGSETRQQMTVYGEAVNLAARLEALGKDPDIRSALIVSEHYAPAAQQSGRSFVEGERTLKGWD